MNLLRQRVPEESQIIPDDLSLRKKPLQCETFGNKFGPFKSHKAIPAAWWNIQKFEVCFGHMPADSGAVQELHSASHKCKPHI